MRQNSSVAETAALPLAEPLPSSREIETSISLRGQKRRFEVLIVVSVLLNIMLGLWLEAYGASQGWLSAELLVSTVTFAHLGFYFWKRPSIGKVSLTRHTLFMCLGLATFGELVLSAVWGLYHYRTSVLPAFVPPGHVLLFLSGLAIVQSRHCGQWAVWLVPALTFPALVWQWSQGLDLLSAPLFVIFLACLVWGRDRKLYAVMFVLALLLEFYGTALGTWTWVGEAPGVPGLTSANPPLAAGVFYALLDLLTVKLGRASHVD